MLTDLGSGEIDAYIADFPSEALIKHHKVILFPHLGASTLEAEENCSIIGARQLLDFLGNGNLINSVNFPTISMERTTG